MIKVAFALTAVVTLLFGFTVDGAKILGLFPIPSISHQITYRPLMRELAQRGHQVTVMTTDPVDEHIANLTQIDVHFTYKTYFDSFSYVDVSAAGGDGVSLYRLFVDVWFKYLHQQMSSPGIKTLLDDPLTRFDVCFVEIQGQPLVGVKDRFRCGLVLISSLTGWSSNFADMSSPYNPVAYSNVFSRQMGERTFAERFFTVYEQIRYYYVRYCEFSSRYDTFAKRYFGEDIRHVDEIEADADLLFLNVNPVLGEIRPAVPTIVYMGGMHLQPPKPPPLEFQTLLERSKQGVIYFSLGTNVKSAELPLEKTWAFLDAFKSLPFTVLWKWENDELPNRPDNVHIFKWMPQNDILAHPNVKLFITQGGQQSFEEAIMHKIPLIVMPFFGDQFLNMDKVIKLNLGMSLDQNTLNGEIIRNKILNTISNPYYKGNITKLSSLFRDQPQSPLERAVWWTEYLIRHGNTRHLKAPHIPFYQYFMFDIIIFLLIFISLISMVLYFTINFLISRVIGKKSKSDIIKKKRR